MHDVRGPGPATKIAVRPSRNKDDLVLVAITDDLEALTKRLEELCSDHAGEGPRRSYFLRALDATGSPVGQMRHTPPRRRAVRNEEPKRQVHPLVEDTLAQAEHAARSYQHLALVSVLEVQKGQDRIIKGLQEENRKLREENLALRARLALHDS